MRKKVNPSGVVSVQIIDKSSGKYKVYKTIGSSNDAIQVQLLVNEAQRVLIAIKGQPELNFEAVREKELVDLFFKGIEQIRLMGPELILGKIFDQIGFNKIQDTLFRHLVITRLCFPVSKLKTTDYLFKYQGIIMDVERIYRYLDKFYSKRKDKARQISYEHTLGILGNKMSIVFYDVTTLYFEIEDQDDLRKTGFSKEGKHQHPQILVGLLVSLEGYPLAYEVFEGNRFEGHTMLPVIEAFKAKYNLGKLIIVADAGLLSTSNINALQTKGYEYILGARIKNESHHLQSQILLLPPENGQSKEIVKDETTRLIISYSTARAKKDENNRKRGLEKLQKAIIKGKLTKQNINNRGYNKFLSLDGEITIKINYTKIEEDKKWDGLKGYLTNTTLTKNEVITQYSSLWKIEKAFRISKTDLRIRPIYHRLPHRIEAHICISFCAYKIYKELERILKNKNLPWSPEKAIEIANTILEITIILPFSKLKESRLHLPNEEQRTLLNIFEK